MLNSGSVRRSVTRVVTAAAMAGLMVGGLAGTAHAATATETTNQQVVNRGNAQCLMTLSWTYAEQSRTRACDTPGSVRDHQMWKFVPALDYYPYHYYRIVNRYTDMCLDVAYLNQDNWAPVVQAGCWGGDNQLWRASPSSNGWFTLRARHSNRCLDISWGAAIQFDCNQSSNQDFWSTDGPLTTW